MKFKAIGFVLIFTFFASAFGLEGQFEGTLDFGTQKLRIITEFASTGKKDIGILYSIDQSTQGIPMNLVSVSGNSLCFKISSIDINFNGTVNGDKIEGTFTQFGKTVPLTLIKNSQEKNIESALEFTLPQKTLTQLIGTWQGTIKPSLVNRLRIKLIFENAGSGDKCKGYLISIDQSDAKIPITKIYEKSGELYVEVSSIGATIKGKLGNGAYEGKFRQGKFSENIKFAKEK